MNQDREALGYYSDHAPSDVRIDSALAAAEFEQRAVNAHHASTLVAVHTVLDEARLSPEVFVGHHASQFNRDPVEFAERAAIADLDHTIDRQFGGSTTLTNHSHLCRNHHRDKHQTKWKITQNDTGDIEWTSPTGFIAAADPPPF